MTNKEAIKYLQQLYPNGGHCWLDEQRIEAIGMAINALQEEPVSKDLDEAAVDYATTDEVLPNGKVMINFQAEKAFKAGAKWQKDKMMQNTIDAQCFGFHGAVFFSFRLPADNYLIGSEVKVIVIKED